KVLETPFENYKKEIEMYQQLNKNNKSYMEIVNNNNQYSQNNYISTNQNNKDALWLAPITVNGIGVYALIDSGAQRTIMTQKLLRELSFYIYLFNKLIFYRKHFVCVIVIILRLLRVKAKLLFISITLVSIP